MESKHRRSFMLTVIASSTALVTSRAFAQTPAKLEESDPQATALGYRQDTTKVDGTKYASHNATQRCGTCQLFGGKPTDTTGPCPIYAGKLVSVNGWCSAYAKKA